MPLHVKVLNKVGNITTKYKFIYKFLCISKYYVWYWSPIWQILYVLCFSVIFERVYIWNVKCRLCWWINVYFWLKISSVHSQNRYEYYINLIAQWSAICQEICQRKSFQTKVRKFSVVLWSTLRVLRFNVITYNFRW